MFCDDPFNHDYFIRLDSHLELPEYRKVHQHEKIGVLPYLSNSIIISWEGYGVHTLDKLSAVSV